ncbi:hypothetical protein SOM26_16510 [Sphingomonas sp. CFBP8993]|uniref:hypothetical protein n=1 Tax=Sphingomonas sp. CFBP8993 TaxID=3096526 RepID=UPI002A699EBC|nr:hypothetical protein [Sphingomonas sp. CFBP8993]MDY0960296.1 hypothetical protein [Sphingomonas sp. CFBP8993]
MLKRKAMRCLRRMGLRQTLPAERTIGLDELEHQWRYRYSRPDPVVQLRRLLSRRRYRAFPDHAEVRPITTRRDRWIAYFVYLPEGKKLDAAHRYTLARLAESDAGLLIVCAAPSQADIPTELRDAADAMFWKALNGFDFSAYAIALHAVAKANPGADMLVLNDSTYGPFVPVDTLWSSMVWDLTGFTATGQVENHVQSYAFLLRQVTPERMAGLSVFSLKGAFDDYQGVVLGQETRLAAQAARMMTVGAWWHADPTVTIDPSLFAAIPLVEAGFPFLKRGLRTKHARIYSKDALGALLVDRGHPVDDI